jgi:archaellum component FlaC
MFNEFKKVLKENIQNQLNEFQENMDKKLEKTQKQLNELKEDFNKLQNKTMEIIKKEINEIKDSTRYECVEYF